MSVMVVVIGVIALLIAVLAALLLSFRHFLKLRERQAPEVVYAPGERIEPSRNAPHPPVRHVAAA
jgi:hypothetical protein